MPELALRLDPPPVCPERFAFLRNALTGRYGPRAADAIVDALLVAQATGSWPR